MKRILLIISGSIAAYKSLELIRRLREREVEVNAILTRGGAEFITPLAVASLTGTQVFSDLFSLKDETEMGHIRLSREADLVIVAPASANIIAKMAAGIADDLATTALLATDKPVMAVPAMNTHMWEHKATQRNLAQIEADGVTIIAPGSGSLACGEIGSGRMADTDAIVTAILHRLTAGVTGNKPLAGRKALVTSGPTFEPIDPVRFIGNYSSGKQGHAIAEALAEAGCDVTLVSGPTALRDPTGVTTVRVATAEEMLKASLAALPSDIAVCAAAVADWRVAAHSDQKLKKRENKTPPQLTLAENPDILQSIARHASKRPALVIGFAAETEHLEENAARKRVLKGCDWIMANDVKEGVFGTDDNRVVLVSATGADRWERMDKSQVAETLAARIALHFASLPLNDNIASHS